MWVGCEWHPQRVTARSSSLQIPWRTCTPHSNGQRIQQSGERYSSCPTSYLLLSVSFSFVIVHLSLALAAHNLHPLWDGFPKHSRLVPCGFVPPPPRCPSRLHPPPPFSPCERRATLSHATLLHATTVYTPRSRAPGFGPFLDASVRQAAFAYLGERSLFPGQLILLRLPTEAQDQRQKMKLLTS